MSKLVEATVAQTATIVGFLHPLMDELNEFAPSAKEQVEPSVRTSFSDNVHWFLFEDEEGKPFGCCYLQSVHNYWRIQKRFYLGGLYFLSSHRGQKRFPLLYKQLQAWVKEHDGCQIYCHIDEHNRRSQRTFEKEGFILCTNKIHRHTF